jgi:hypothetical protein
MAGSLRRRKKYALFLKDSHALHPAIFEQPLKKTYLKTECSVKVPATLPFFYCQASFFNLN